MNERDTHTGINAYTSLYKMTTELSIEWREKEEEEIKSQAFIMNVMAHK